MLNDPNTHNGVKSTGRIYFYKNEHQHSHLGKLHEITVKLGTFEYDAIFKINIAAKDQKIIITKVQNDVKSSNGTCSSIYCSESS